MHWYDESDFYPMMWWCKHYPEPACDKSAGKPICTTAGRPQGGKQESQLQWKAQHSLAHERCGEYLVNQQRSTFGHSTRPAAGAKPAPFSTERDQVLMMAFAALHP
jgi:hypothetical protein